MQKDSCDVLDDLRNFVMKVSFNQYKDFCSRCESPIEEIFALSFFLTFVPWYFNSPDYKKPYAVSFIPRFPIRFSNQVNIGQYRVDFLISTRNLKIIVECDGHDFHEKTKEQAARDKQRDRKLTADGYTILRFSGSEIYNKCSWCIMDVLSVLANHFEKEVKNGQPTS